MGDAGEKSFEPTRARLEKAKREGDLPRSTDLAAACAFACGLAGAVTALPNIAASARAAFRGVAQHPFAFSNPDPMLGILAFWALVPAVCSAAGASAATLLQSGGFRMAPITLKFDRLHPLEGMKRMVSREALVNAVRASFAVACAAAVVTPSVLQLLAAGSGARSAQLLAQLAWATAIRCAFSVAILGALFGGVDFAMTFAKWRKKLRMSFDEVKRDHKEEDGDPATKGRRRAMHRDISRSSFKRLKDAAFVVVNPTHIAIALEYDPPKVAVPRVLIKAADELALRVRDGAAELRIPVIENVALARSLYATTNAGSVIPKQSFIAVAEIVAALTKSGALA